MKPIDHDVVAMSLAHINGDVEVVRELMGRRPELEKLAPDSTWLHRAAEAGQIGVVDFWLDHGWDVNHAMPGGSKADGLMTPLHCAKDAEMTRHLLSRGAFVNAWNRYGGTPLHSAVIVAVEPRHQGRRSTARANTGQIQALLDAGADPSLANLEGRTPLALAIELRRNTAAQFLRDAGAPEEGHRPANQPVKPPAIDLRKDGKRIAKALESAIRRFAIESPGRPLTGLLVAVSGIEGFVMIAFDSNGGDNPWDASDTEYAYVKFDKWTLAYRMEGGVKITQMDGAVLVGPSPVGDNRFEGLFFEACVAVLENAQRSDGFAALSRTDDFLVSVQSTSGEHERTWRP